MERDPRGVEAGVPVPPAGAQASSHNCPSPWGFAPDKEQKTGGGREGRAWGGGPSASSVPRRRRPQGWTRPPSLAQSEHLSLELACVARKNGTAEADRLATNIQLLDRR